jgi:hypothetical protein
MEKLFGVQSIINEQEEENTEDDEYNYRHKFLEELKNQEMEYIRNNTNNPYPNVYSSDPYQNSNQTPVPNSLKVVKKGKNKVDYKFSPYLDSDNEISRNKMNCQSSSKNKQIKAKTKVANIGKSKF